jgi:hypothetical protein
LPITEISEKPPSQKIASSVPEHFNAFVGISLFVLLMFATLTVWERHAWSTQAFQIGIFSLVIARVISGIFYDSEGAASGLLPLLVYLIPAWGLIQILFHTTTSSFDTREAVLRWGSLAGVLYLTQTMTCLGRSRRKFLSAVLTFATVMAVIFLLQFNTSDGRILWVLPTGYSPIYGTFQNRDNYVQFVEIALPIALWGAVRNGWRSWWNVIVAGLLYASAIGAASRAGFILCSAELLSVPILGLIRNRRSQTNVSIRSVASIILIIPIVAGAFTLAVGWDQVLTRFKEEDPFAVRREFLIGAVEMAKHRPLTGYGLNTFDQVYQGFAVKDLGVYAGHVHNDWAEFAADGGIPFLLLVAIPFIGAVPVAWRHPWGLGLVATMLSACVDFPFPRLGVSCWMFAMLAALYSARRADQSQTPPRKRSFGQEPEPGAYFP